MMRIYIDGQYSGGVVWRRERHSEASGSKIDVGRTWEGTGTSTRKVMYYFPDLETRGHLMISSMSNIAD